MSDHVPSQPEVGNRQDAEHLAAMWAQMRHGRRLSPVQAAHLFFIGYRAGREQTEEAAGFVVATLHAGHGARLHPSALARWLPWRRRTA